MKEKVGGGGGGGGSWNLYSVKRAGGSPVFHQQKGDAHKSHQSSSHILVDFHRKTYARY